MEDGNRGDMNYHAIRLRLLPILSNLDKILAIFGMLFSSFLIFLGISSNKPTVLLIGIFLLISFILWLSMRESHLLIINFPVSRFQFKVWAIVYFIFYTLSILIFHLRSNLYERPILYFLLIALMAGVLACEILFAEKKHSGFILIQVVILGMSITWTQLLITPGLVGIDPWYHSALTTSIIREGILPFGYSYSKLPIFHIIIAITSIASSFTYKFAALVSVSFGQIACNALFIFLIGNNLFKNYRIGLLAALFVIIADLHIRMAYWSIPNAFGAIFITIILYLLFIRLKCSPKLETLILVILIMAVIILTHTIIAICMAILLFVAWGVLAFYRFFYSLNENYITLLIPIGFTVAMLTWWSYLTGNLRQLANFIAFDFSLSKVDSFSQLTNVSSLEVIYATIGQNIFLTISLIGILYMISRRGNSSTFSLAILSCIPLSISFIAYIYNSEIIGYRWVYISEILMSIPLALALYVVSSVKLKKPIFKQMFFFGFIVILGFFMIMGAYGNDDNHFLIPNLGRSNFYTQAEITGSKFFADKSTGLISSDITYAYNPSSSVFEHVYGINREKLAILDLKVISNIVSHDDSLKIIRTRYISDIQTKSEFPSNTQPDDYIYIFNSNFNKIYENPTVFGYI